MDAQFQVNIADVSLYGALGHVQFFGYSSLRVPFCQQHDDLSKERNLFKLFYSDVGLLTSSYMCKTSLGILDNGMDMSFGSTFENAVAQELIAHGFDLYYYNSKKFGEVDFVVSDKNDTVLPIEVKSGKDYARHKALGKILEVRNYHLERGFVLGSANVSVEGKVAYLPVYMAGLFQSE